MDTTTSIPAGVVLITTARPRMLIELPPFALPGADAPGVAVWSGENAPPRIGDEVVVRARGLGTAHVIGYFEVEGKLGVVVRLQEPPTWFVLLMGAGRDRCTVFGHEL